MPKGYRHLTHIQRCQVSVLLRSGESKRKIARLLKVSPSTISREVKRNSGKRGYRHKQAHAKASTRRQSTSSKPRTFVPHLRYMVDYLLVERQWSPEQISGWLSRRNGPKISHERIYQYIWQDKKNGGKLYKHLRRRGKKYNYRGNKLAGRGLIPNRVDIKQRPAIVDEKKRLGDLEADTIVGARRKGAILSLVDRKSKLTLLHLLPNTTSEMTLSAMLHELKPLKKYVHTITSDNGKEFAKHEEVSKELDADFFFATPYHSWERGLNENTNGLVRQYFPKKTPFDKLTEQDVKRVQHLLNTRPRKTLNYKTPLEVFFADHGHTLGVALRC